MEIDFFVEEPSAEEALKWLLPTMLREDIVFRILSHQGKADLLKKLPARLRGMKWKFDRNDYLIVVLIDEDRQDCRLLKQELESIALDARLSTKSSPDPDGSFQVLNRIAVEELEAWFFGDLDALRTAYPSIPQTLMQRAGFRDPDAIGGGTCDPFPQDVRYTGVRLNWEDQPPAASQPATQMCADLSSSFVERSPPPFSLNELEADESPLSRFGGEGLLTW